MPFTLIASNSTITTGHHIWMVDGRREICINYSYMPGTGVLSYAASIFRKSDANYVLTDQDIDNHESTTDRRWEIRPAHVHVPIHLTGIEILQEIRYQMCHGPGCKGARPTKEVVVADDTSSQASSEDSFLSYMDEETAFNDQNMGGGPIYAITHDFEDKN